MNRAGERIIRDPNCGSERSSIKNLWLKDF